MKTRKKMAEKYGKSDGKDKKVKSPRILKQGT